ncbi:hypothetical protein [Streptomyces africanus]|uniref:hypothetical protein n=1 Tax=Streptomyces africanus TaxID=231024 RepID=UPI0013021F3B|nr:hypothetical protein [Streptomyces africanus]
MTTTVLTKTPPRPVTPRPLWERHQLFQEPTYQDGQPYTGDDQGEDEESDE